MHNRMYIVNLLTHSSNAKMYVTIWMLHFLWHKEVYHLWF